jgi:endonuclease V-like protein UPF0215 family
VAHGIAHVIGFDDTPFAPTHRGDVWVVGAVFSGLRLDGVVSAKVRRDGANATRTLIDLVSRSRFASQLQLIMLQGVAFAGFNVVDVRGLHDALGVPVMVVARRAPDMAAVRDALLSRVPGGRRKWRLIEALGPMVPVAGVYVQCVGLPVTQAEEAIRHFAIHGAIPEPLRTAHIIAGGIAGGHSRQRV